MSATFSSRSGRFSRPAKTDWTALFDVNPAPGVPMRQGLRAVDDRRWPGRQHHHRLVDRGLSRHPDLRCLRRFQDRHRRFRAFDGDRAGSISDPRQRDRAGDHRDRAGRPRRVHQTGVPRSSGILESPWGAGADPMTSPVRRCLWRPDCLRGSPARLFTLTAVPWSPLVGTACPTKSSAGPWRRSSRRAASRFDAQPQLGLSFPYARGSHHPPENHYGSVRSLPTRLAHHCLPSARETLSVCRIGLRRHTTCLTTTSPIDTYGGGLGHVQSGGFAAGQRRDEAHHND